MLSDEAIFDEAAPRPSIAIPLGAELEGRFRVGRLLGRPGGFGITYLALDTRLGRPVAIKEFFPRSVAARDHDGATVLPQTPDEAPSLATGRDRFLKEARDLARFHHPGIVGVQDQFEANGTAYLVMPYVEGTTLEAYLREQPDGRLAAETAVGLALPVLDALRVVHAEGLLHRDLKPENVYLRRGTGRPLLLDFGAARTETAQRSRTVDRALTPGYAAVEQYLSEGEQGPWTDLYGVGATLYRMLTGQAPVEALQRLGTRDPLPPVQDLAPDVSDGLAEAVGWALRPQALDRPQTARALQERLERLPEAPGGPAASDPPPVSPPTPPAKPDQADPDRPPMPDRAAGPDRPPAGRSRAFTWAALGLVVLALGGYGAYEALTRVTLSGSVTRAGGAALRGVEVVLLREGEPVKQALTGFEGDYAFGWLRPGPYRIEASMDGFVLGAPGEDPIEGIGPIDLTLRSDETADLVAHEASVVHEQMLERAAELFEEGVEGDQGAPVRRAVDLLDRAEQIQPLEDEQAAMRAFALWFVGDYAACVDRASGVSDPDVRELLARCHIGTGGYAEARRLLAPLADAPGSDALRAHVALAVVEERSGDREAALEHVAHAVERHLPLATTRARPGVDSDLGPYSEGEWETVRELLPRFREDLYQKAFSPALRQSVGADQLGRLLFFDRFNTDDQWSTSRALRGGRASIDDGEIQIEQPSSGSWSAVLTDVPHTDFVARFAVRQVAGPRNNLGGFVFRRQGGLDYRVGFTGDGSYRLYQYNGRWQPVGDYQKTSALRTGPDDWNLVELRVSGAAMQLYINEAYVDTYPVSNNRAGREIGFFTGSSNRRFAFDYVVVYALDA